MKIPNFFIVGAPKCGTTAMYEYLKDHPEIFVPTYKEPHFFAKDFFGPWIERFRDEGDYRALYANIGSKERVGDCSVWYLRSELAAREIQRFNPDSRIIIMLRSPVEMMYALYQHLFFLNSEDLPTFEAALDAEVDRRQGLRLPPTLHFHREVLLYREAACFTSQVKRYFDHFGRESVHVIIYDDFKADTPRVFRQTLEFLDVNPSFQPEFKIVNPNKFYRNRIFQEFLVHPPRWMMMIGKKVLPISRPIYWRLRGLNTRELPRAPMSLELKRQLQIEFLPEVEQLSELLERDLTHWCRD